MWTSRRKQRRGTILASVLRSSAVTLFIAGLLFGPTAWGQTIEAVDRTALRICADPHNLPFSNDKGEGFENKIAELLASEMKVPVHYTFYPQSIGFLRNTLAARRCDLVMGMPSGNDLVLSTNPYYRSAYAIVSRADRNISIDRLDDPSLKTMHIGLIAGTPPATLISDQGLLENVRPYPLVVDTRYDAPGKQMLDDIAKGEIDVGILWGPIAGYFAKQQNPPLKVVPLVHERPGSFMDFWISMGVRTNVTQWKHDLNELIQRKRPEIEAILKDFGVPLLGSDGELLQ